MAVRLHSRESVAPSAHYLVDGITAPAPAQVQEAAGGHNLHVTVSNASLLLGRARARSVIWGIGGELILGRISQPGSLPATDAVCPGDTSDVNESEGALSNPESHTFGLPIVGVAGSLLPRCARRYA
jgi:hypothetical protein